jgi:hypothetical protein
MEELERDWTHDDMVLAHLALNALDDARVRGEAAERKAAEQARNQRRERRRGA